MKGLLHCVLIFRTQNHLEIWVLSTAKCGNQLVHLEPFHKNCITTNMCYVKSSKWTNWLLHLPADDPKERRNCTPVQRLDPKLRHGSFYCQCVWSSESHVRNERHVTLFKHQRVLPWSFGSYCIAARWYVLNWFTSEEPLQTSDICLHKPELIILLSRCLVKAHAVTTDFAFLM